MKKTAKDWFRPFARAGYAARGLIYTVIGVYAAMAGFGGGETKGSRDAIGTLVGGGFGRALAYALIVGLISYAIWRFIQSIFDTDSHGTDARGLMVRGGLLASAATYSLLALYTGSIVTGYSSGSGGGSGGGGNDSFASQFAGIVGAQWAAAAIAIVFVGVGIAHVVKAVTGKYEDHIDAGEDAMTAIHPIAKTGLLARAVTFFVIAFLFGFRSLTADDGGSPGLQEALEFIRGLPAGEWLLAAIGIGLVAFALYSFTEAWYRRINVDAA